MPDQGVGPCRIRIRGSKTPVSFVKSCDRFIAMEILAIPAEDQDGQVSAPGLMAVEGGKSGMNEGKVGSGEDDGSPLTMTETSAVVGSKDVASPARVSAIQRATKKDQGLTNLVKSAYLSVAGEDGWAHLVPFHSQLLNLSPSFDPRNFGCSKLGDFVVAIDLFEVKKVPIPKSPLSQFWYIKAK